MKKTAFLAVIIMVSLFFNISMSHAESPLSQTIKLKSVESSAVVLLPELDLEPLRNKAFNGGAHKALKFAETTDHDIDAQTMDGWLRVNSNNQDMSIWRLVIESPNAYSINLGFTSYSMPEDGKLFIYTDDYEYVVGPFTDEDNEEHGQLWSPIIPGKRITVEVNVPTSSVADLTLVLKKINQAYLDITKLSEEANSLKSGSCNFDVVCPQGDAWRSQIQSVAVYSTGGSLFCTGAAINNTENDKRPFFLTANHCGINSSNAPSVVAYWNFQNSTCRASGSSASGGSGNGSLSQFNSGAILRASYSISDMTLIEFDDPVLSSANVFFSGWNRANSTFSSAVAIHHPNVDEKRISFENNPVTISGYLSGTGSGSTHIRVADWDLGTTEPGSSGSPLFDPQRRIIGQLEGGFAACGNDAPDWYGRIHTSWTGGSSNSTRLQNWLDPNNSGVIAIGGVFASAVVDSPVEPSDPSDEQSELVILPSIFILLEGD